MEHLSYTITIIATVAWVLFLTRLWVRRLLGLVSRWVGGKPLAEQFLPNLAYWGLLLFLSSLSLSV